MGYIFEAMNRAGDEPEPRKRKPAAPPGERSAERGTPKPAQGLRLSSDDQPAPLAEPVQPQATAPPPAAEPPKEELPSLASAIELARVEAEAAVPAPDFAAPAPEVAAAQPRLTAPEPEQVHDEPITLAQLDTGEPDTPEQEQELSIPIDERLVAVTEPASVMAEEYRAIRTSILAKYQNRRHLVHTITSATPQEGKTITSLNLGLSFAELRNRKTIVVEADLRLPQFKALLGMPTGPGLVDLLEGHAKLDDVIQDVGGNHLHVLPAGRAVADQAVQLLSSGQTVQLIKILRNRYDHVIIDTPPVIELADAGILGTMGDGVLLIARMNRTPQTLVEQAIRTLASYNAPVAGLIATDQQPSRQRYYYRYGRYGYRYGYRYGKSYAKAA